MFEYVVFFFPSGPHDRACAIEGHVMCPSTEVWGSSDEQILAAYPMACRIYRQGRDGGCIFIAAA